jgi:hypothetical protein
MVRKRRLMAMNEKKVIGYVGTRNLGQMREEDIRKLDVINIAF